MLYGQALLDTLNRLLVAAFEGVTYRAVDLEALFGFHLPTPYPQPLPLFSAGASRRGARYTPIGGPKTLYLALDHLMAGAPTALPEAIELPGEGSPFGSLVVNVDRCTLCLSCVSACPASALQDNPERPQLKFIEKNCVQCGLCATTCPEDAITLQPRLLLTPQRKEARVLSETQPYHCIRCGKPFGTLKAIESMLGKLAGHAMFQGAAADRLKMCGDCRVIDIYSADNELKITDIR